MPVDHSKNHILRMVVNRRGNGGGRLAGHVFRQSRLCIVSLNTALCECRLMTLIDEERIQANVKQWGVVLTGGDYLKMIPSCSQLVITQDELTRELLTLIKT